MPGGRRNDAVWRCYQKSIDELGHTKAKCLGCGLSMMGIPKRLRMHAAKCTPLQDTGLTEDLGLDSGDEVSNADSSSLLQFVVSLSACTLFSAPERPKKRQCVLDVQKTGPDTLQKIHAQLVRWVVSSNCAFSVVEDPEFLKFVHMLRPGVHLPGRKKVGGDLLEELYVSELSDVQARLTGRRASVAVDGWSTVQRDPVLGVSLSVGCRTFLVNTIDTTGFLLLLSSSSRS